MKYNRIKNVLFARPPLFLIGLIMVLIFLHFSIVENFFNKKVPVPVDYIVVKKSPFRASISATGIVKSRRISAIISTMNGIILDNGYKNKDYVKKGTEIAYIRLVEQELGKKHQQLKIAKIDFEILHEQKQQAEELFAAKAISERELKEVVIREYKQRIHVSELEKELADQALLAPFDGMIINKKFIHKAPVFNNYELFTIVDPNDIYVEIPVLQQDISLLKNDQKIIFSGSIFNGTRQGMITEISNLVVQDYGLSYEPGALASFNIFACISIIPGDPLLFGATVEAEIILDEKENIISIPLEAILFKNEEKYVFIIDDNRAKIRIIETGKHNTNSIEIVTGLSEGERVITRGNLNVEAETLVDYHEHKVKKLKF